MSIGKAEWIQAAVEALGRSGVDAIRIEQLARDLKVTKGSFYWHFKDRADLLDSLLSEWEAETDALLSEARKGRSPRKKLERFLEVARAAEGRIPEIAIFMWARKDPRVARRVKRTELARIEFLTSTLEAMNMPTDEAEVRAELSYMSFLGMADRVARDADWRDRRDFLFDRLVSVFLDTPGQAPAD